MRWSQALIVMLAVASSGCIVRSYPLTKDRVDQDLTTGNRGYLQGQAPAVDTSERKTTRTTQVVEVEFKPLINFEKGPKAKSVKPMPVVTEQSEAQEGVGNRGYITQSISPEVAESTSMEKYTVQKGDTLQKISKKFYGTTKKWPKIFDANKDKLSVPNKIRPGQAINIPAGEKSVAKEEVPKGLK